MTRVHRVGARRAGGIRRGCAKEVSMSEFTVRQEIAAMRAQADRIDATANDPNHSFSDESHRERLRTGACRLRAQAQREEEALEKRRRPDARPTG
jgi:hypothetical protein